MQGLGQLAASLMALIVISAYKSDLVDVPNVASCSGSCVAAVDKMWRLIIAFGGVPGWFALYYRLTIPETPRYTFDVLYDVEKASIDTRRYRYGKAGNTVNPVEQALVRRDMVSLDLACVHLFPNIALRPIFLPLIVPFLNRPNTKLPARLSWKYSASIRRRKTSSSSSEHLSHGSSSI